MNSKVIVFTVFMCFVAQITQTQTRSLKETKVVFVIENGTNTITALELFNQEETKALLKKYPNSKFYLGLLLGEFTVKDNMVSPSINTSITIYTNKNELTDGNLLIDDTLLQGDTFLPGDPFNSGHKFFINNTKLQVIERSKSQLVFKTY
jgi:hypothetical protein